MTPLELRIGLGDYDGDPLLRVIDDLERMRQRGGLSIFERRTLDIAYERLDMLTHPTDLLRRAERARTSS